MQGSNMIRKLNIGLVFISTILILIFLIHPCQAGEAKTNSNIDDKVSLFLERHRDQWVDWNVPEVDGKILYDLIIKNNFKKALDIGTSTGHSAIWMAWALSKTGGKLITIEIHEDRYKKALANFREAGLLNYIDARLADAHELVKELKGAFDFVFCDADKEWYKNYFIELEPKLEVGGCFTAHNVSASHWNGIREFLEYLEKRPSFETTIDTSSPAGISISCKKAEK